MQRERIPCVYILASGMRGTLYIGVSSDLPRRVWQHRNDQAQGFTRRHRIHALVWYEVHDRMESAILREKALKAWKRIWKIQLIEAANPDWRDLYPDLLPQQNDVRLPPEPTETPMTIPTSFTAFRIHNDADGYRSGIEQVGVDDLAPGEVVVKAAYSSVNFKDALAGTGEGKILRRFPLVGGIDVAGHVVASTDPKFREGDEVLVTGCGLSETRDGGYSQYVRLEARWVIALPKGLGLRDSMILGTAGFTAALALLRMRENRQTPELGPLAVTGATGGVGSLAVDIFSRAGFEVHAISGKPEHADYLKAIGATQVLGRDALATTRPMESARFGGGLDNVGGPMLASLLAQTIPYGNVASAGLAASADLPTTVMPFIIRGVSLLGVASAGTARDIREQVWTHLADDWKPRHLDLICTREVGLGELPDVFAKMLQGGSLGRTLVVI
jgi:acrylyl-CoA reductase (NADPH)